MAICKLIPQLNHYTTKFLDIFYFTMMVLLIEIFTSAIQLTPFQRIDHLVYQLEPLPLDQLIAWTNKHPLIKEHLQNIYATLIPGMLTLPFFAVFLLKRTMIHRWIKLNIIYVCLGFSFYYFFPTCGPVSVIPFPEIFDQGQLNNILKFNQIHQWKMPTTEDGGLIAFPSFHVIWAWAITLFFKWIHPWLFRIALVWFVLICISCVCLGWHYSVDIIGSILLIGIAHFFISKTETTKAS
jgi:membrane-associated phospholipid phosphatase